MPISRTKLFTGRWSATFADRSLLSQASAIRTKYKEEFREREALERQKNAKAAGDPVKRMKSRTDKQRAKDRAKTK
jgi:hypothetical protein